MGMIGGIKDRIDRRIHSSMADIRNISEKQLVLQGIGAAKINRERECVKDLASVEFSVFSQWGEDGILDWLVAKLGDLPDSFVEFGVGNYLESNSRFLLQARNWRGLILDGSDAYIEGIKRQDFYWRHDLTAVRAFIERENINSLIEGAGFSGEIGILSVDIDGNDYWVWQAIEVVDPVIVVCEYNAVFGDLYKLSVPYAADFQRGVAHPSHLYFGASLPALIGLGEEKGYQFVGTNLNGCNAFFVRKDRASEVVEALEGITRYPSRFREARDPGGDLSFAGGRSRLALISDMPIVDVEKGTEQRLVDFGDLYSSDWEQRL